MRLLLDEMHAPAVAVALRRHGYDVVAVKERAELEGLPDPQLLRAAKLDERAVVTENVKDFAALHKASLSTGQPHAGLVFTLSNRFPRSAGDHVQVLVQALEEFLSEEAAVFGGVESFVWWLEPARLRRSKDS